MIVLTEEMEEILKKQRKETGPFAVWHIEGGHGKGILATAVIEAFKKQYPDHKIIVVTAWEAPWLYNPNVYRVYNFGNTPYFYDNYIFEDTLIFRIDPYHTQSHILQKTQLIKTWCDLYQIPYNNEMPKLYINPREIEIARDKIKPDQGKPILLLQTHGGAPNQYSRKSWARDMPMEIAQTLVNYYSKSYRILHIKREDQPELIGVEPLLLPHRETYATFTFSEKRLFIDSFSQHTAAALGLPSVVCWIANKPSVFGYELHKNIFPNKEVINYFDKYSYMEHYDITGNAQQFPFDNVNVFDVNEIVSVMKTI